MNHKQKISKLIHALEAFKVAYGDLPVHIAYGEYGGHFETIDKFTASKGKIGNVNCIFLTDLFDKD